MSQINLREEISKLINKENGLRVLYIRNNKYVRCKCYNPLHMTGDTKCPYCAGFGHISTIQSANMILDNNYVRTGDISNEGYGFIAKDSIIAYTDYTLMPKVKDRIYIAGWIKDIPKEVQQVYVITDINEMRLENGRIEGYMITAKLRADLLKSANVSLNALTLKAKQILGKGGKYICPYNNIQT